MADAILEKNTPQLFIYHLCNSLKLKLLFLFISFLLVCWLYALILTSHFFLSKVLLIVILHFSLVMKSRIFWLNWFHKYLHSNDLIYSIKTFQPLWPLVFFRRLSTRVTCNLQGYFSVISQSMSRDASFYFIFYTVQFLFTLILLVCKTRTRNRTQTYHKPTV